MVGLGFNKVMVGLVLTVIFCNRMTAQDVSFQLDSFRNWNIVLGPVVYDRATVYSDSGPFEFKPKNMLGYNVGINYYFPTFSKWAVSTGLIIALEPGYRFDTFIKKEDAFPQFTEDLGDPTFAYSATSFSIPILVHYKIRDYEKFNIDLFSGLKAMYFPSGYLEFVESVANRTQSIGKEVFGLYLDSPDNYIQGSFIFGAGVELHKKRLWKMNIIRVVNFQNILEGQYLTKNLNITPLSEGKYKLSGNYWGILFSVGLKKKNS